MIKPQIILCADDYAQNQKISEGICELVADQRLTAVSCMTTTFNWSEAAKMIKPYESTIDIGMHFNLTHGTLSTRVPYSHNTLMQQCLLGKLDPQIVVDELTAQLERFVDMMKRPPDFIDGHQHIQQLPIVRDALIKVYQQQFKTHKPYIRIACMNSFSSLLKSPNKLKQLLIHFTGANKLRQLVLKHQIPHNLSFAGIYDFDTRRDYAEIFKQFLATVTGPCLVMCHPGQLSDEDDDAIKAMRLKELAYFKSQQFIDDLKTMNLPLCRFQDSL